jgi:hypothetical protein
MRLIEIRKKIGRFKNGLLLKSSDSAGDLKTRFRGSGLQFKEHQVYAAGDDVRFIDWKILAKTNTPFIKTFEEERSTKIHCIVDAGQSMLMGLDGVTKLQLALEFCVFLYYVAEQTKDRVSVSLVSNNVKNIQEGYGEKAVDRLIRVLSKEGIVKNGDYLRIGTNNWPTLDEELLKRELKKHSSQMKNIIVLSDFLDIEDLDSCLNYAGKNIRMLRVSNGFEDCEESYNLVFARGANSVEMGGPKKNTEYSQKISKKTKIISIKPSFVDGFKEALKN